jgi:AcrR family transcriptional regulator
MCEHSLTFMSVYLSKRQTEIIETAIKLIGDGGIQALTIKNLSNKIGVTESAIYRHFKSRTEILETLLDSIKENIIAKYTQAAKSKKSSFEKIEDMITFQFETFSANPSFAIVILSDGLYQNEPGLRSKIYAIMEFAKKTFIGIIEEGMKLGEIRNDIPGDQMAFVIMGSVRLMINQWSLSGFSYDLKKKGDILYRTLNTLLQISK